MNASIFWAELVGTGLLIIIGEGLVAGATLNKSGMQGAGIIQISLGWGFAVMIPAFICGATSGAHFNPAVSIAMCLDSGDFSNLPSYLSGQFIGAFLGAWVVYLLFRQQFDETENQAAIKNVFCTGPAIRDAFENFLSEMVGTFILVFSIKGCSNVPQIGSAMIYIYVCIIITAVVMCIGGLTGAAINPARDLMPRLVHALMPCKTKGDSDWSYAWIPIVAPIVGGILAVLLFKAIPW